MSKLDKQCSVVNTVHVPPGILKFLQSQDDSDENSSNCAVFDTIGGVSNNLQFAWMANGNRIQVIDAFTSQRVSSWCFNSTRKCYIRCVHELPNGSKTPFLLIALDYEFQGGMLCVFDISCSKIIRSIQLQFKVSNIWVVDPGWDETAPVPGILKTFVGTIAVGADGGDIYLVDLAKNSWGENLAELILCDKTNLNVLESYKNSGTPNHLGLKLNDSTGTHFILKTPQGKGALQLQRDRVHISSLLYVPQLISLFVGYNFGAWQIYNILTLELEYTSPVYEEIVPVSHFAFQEPSDDPKAFCYIWAVYSNDSQSEQGAIPLATMYALAYQTKEVIENYGTLYQKLSSCSLRFQMDLLPMSDNPDRRGGHCIALQPYVNITNIDNMDQRLTLCMIAWSSWPVGSTIPDVSLAVVDLDQWYKEQMPSTIRNPGNACFIAQFNLTNILSLSPDSEPFLDFKLDISSISPFSTPQRLEEHYYPAALSFNCVSMRSSALDYVVNNGLQRNLLMNLEQNGIDVFLRPDHFALDCISNGLQPIDSANTPTSQLLSIALEHRLIGLLMNCAQKWATGAYASADCTLGLFVEWASQRFEFLQQKTNELCVSLFDHSGINLDCNARRILDHCAIQMHDLSTVFRTINKKCAPSLNENGQKEISEYLNAFEMFAEHLQVLQWLLNIGFLPEAPEKSYEHITNRVPYPAERLMSYYKEQRINLNKLNGLSSYQAERQPCSLMFIDCFIENECGGESLRKEWSSDSGVANNPGLYPPSSIQALLRTYLISNASVQVKHSILLYIFLDLAMYLDQDKYAETIKQLIKFPSIFGLSPGRIKMIQAFWHLDHGNFELGMKQIVDPVIGKVIGDEFKPWQHRTILKMLRENKQYKNAALYIRMRQPPFNDDTEICDAIFCFLSNQMLPFAFEFQRRHTTTKNKKHILTKFFEGCLHTDLIYSALKLVLTQEEEDVLMEVLSKDDLGDTLKIVYYLQRSKWYEALLLGKRLQGQKGLHGQESMEFTQILLNTYMDSMPDVCRDLFENFQSKRYSLRAQTKPTFEEIKKPTPMSCHVIKNGVRNIKYRSNFLEESICKVREIWKEENNERPYELESTPFLCTPKVPEKEKEIIPPVTYPKITYYHNGVSSKKRSYETYENESIIEHQPPSKRFKISGTPAKATATEKLLLTPIVKRKISADFNKSVQDTTPHSILKVRSTQLYREATPELDECAPSSDEDDKKENDTIAKGNWNREVSPSPRKPLRRTTAVHFEGLPDVSSSPEKIEENDSRESLPKSPENETCTPTQNDHSKYDDNEPPKIVIESDSSNSSHSDAEVAPTPLQEVQTIARKLNSPYTSVRPRRSLQRAVLENSLVKSITRQRSPHREPPAKPQTSSEEDFESNIQHCSSPAGSPRPRSTLLNDSFLTPFMEELDNSILNQTEIVKIKARFEQMFVPSNDSSDFDFSFHIGNAEMVESIISELSSLDSSGSFLSESWKDRIRQKFAEQSSKKIDISTFSTSKKIVEEEVVVEMEDIEESWEVSTEEIAVQNDRTVENVAQSESRVSEEDTEEFTETFMREMADKFKQTYEKTDNLEESLPWPELTPKLDELAERSGEIVEETETVSTRESSLYLSASEVRKENGEDNSEKESSSEEESSEEEEEEEEEGEEIVLQISSDESNQMVESNVIEIDQSSSEEKSSSSSKVSSNSENQTSETSQASSKSSESSSVSSKQEDETSQASSSSNLVIQETTESQGNSNGEIIEISSVQEINESSGDSIQEVTQVNSIQEIQNPEIHDIEVAENRNTQLEKIEVQDTNKPSEENKIPSEENEIPSEENEIPSEENEIPSQDDKIPSHENEISGQENVIQSQENKISSQENEIPIQENEIPSKENEISSQETKISSQDNVISSQENEILSQENEDQKLSQNKMPASKMEEVTCIEDPILDDSFQPSETEDKTSARPLRRSSRLSSNRSLTNIEFEPLRTRRTSITESVKLENSLPRTRRSSITESVNLENSLPRTRRTSINENVKVENNLPRKAKSVTLEVPTPPRRSRASSEIIENYSSSRRLTRKQKSMLEKCTLKPTEESDESIIEDRGPDLEQIDPIKLLDKKPYEGPPDPDEEKILRSPASSIVSSIGTDRIMTRSRSRTPTIDLNRSVTPTDRVTRSSSKTPENKMDTSRNSIGKAKTQRKAASVIGTERIVTRRMSRTSVTPEKDVIPPVQPGVIMTRRRSLTLLTPDREIRAASVGAERIMTRRRSRTSVTPERELPEGEGDKKVVGIVARRQIEGNTPQRRQSARVLDKVNSPVKVTGQASRRLIIQTGLTDISEENSESSGPSPAKRGRPASTEEPAEKVKPQRRSSRSSRN